MHTRNCIILLAVTILLASLSACGQKNEGNKGTDITHRVKVGVLTPLTGPYAWAGQRARQGIEIAQDELRAKGIETESIYEDSTCINVKKAVDSFKKVTEFDKVDVVVGPYCGSPVYAVKPLAEKQGIIFISPWGGPLSSGGNYFSMALVLEDESDAMIEFVTERLKAKTVAIYYFQSDWGIAHFDLFSKKFSAAGGKIVFSGSFTGDTKDHRTELYEIKRANPDVLFVVVSGMPFGDITRQAREIGLTNTILSQFGIEDASTIVAAGDSLEGVYYTYPDFPSTEKGKLFYDEHYRRYGLYPTVTEPQTYDAFMFAVDAIVKCGRGNLTCQQEYLTGLDGYEAASGKISYKGGKLSRKVIIKTVKNGEFVKLSDL